MTALSNVDPEWRKYAGSLGGRARAAKLTPDERRLSANKAAKARLTHLTPEQLQERMRKAREAQLAKTTPDERREAARKASKAYWTRMTAEQRSESVRARVQGRTPEVRRASARKASECRWGQLAYAANQIEADRVYAFLREYISANRYAPTLREIFRATGYGDKRIDRLLQILDRIGRIQRHPWVRGIALTTPTSDTAAPISLEPSSQPVLLSSATHVTVDRAVEDLKRLKKVFKGVVISKLTVGQIARYFRLRCVEAGKDTAEREANVLLGFRFPELFLERRTNLEKLTDFIDTPRTRRGCKSCGSKFVKIRPNQRYCSARCRAREKRRRREATPHGKLLKNLHNKHYRERHRVQEREQHRKWKAGNREKIRAQREREYTRRSLNSAWNRKLFRKLPSAIAALRLTNGI